MQQGIQDRYERDLSRFLHLIFAPTEFGIISKFEIYRSLLGQHERLGDALWEVEPLLPYIIKSIEVDLHMAAARLLGASSDKSERSLPNFIDFCIRNSTQIRLKVPSLSERALFGQKQKIEAHRDAIASIKGRRNKFFAHADKKYFDQPERIYDDYPLGQKDFISLLKTLIEIVGEHERWLHPNTASGHFAEALHISVDNMVRNLRVGRDINFKKNSQNCV